ncbi:MAG: hypothetical protein HGA61_02810 [Candidatus Moranbacteria bacterium]|nr:hypothetical protein [Candidatus Moranbacteria bacterium]
MPGEKEQIEIEKNPELMNILNEVNQPHTARKDLLMQWSNKNENRNVISYFGSFNLPGSMIDDRDRDVFEEILSNMDTSKGLDLILNSPGGLPLAAERIIQVCRAYSSDFRVVVPKMAKSAATMIAFGANTILLGETSELGPIDPQLAYKDQRGEYAVHSAYAIMRGVDDVLTKIQSLPVGARPEGLLSLLPPIDQPFIEECKIAQDLSKDIAIRYLKMTTFPNLKESISECTQGEDCIEAKIVKFLNPEKTFSHGRPITFEEAQIIGLNVKLLKKEDPNWNLLLKIYSRTNFIVQNSGNIAKLIESPMHSFSASISPQ